MLSISQGSMGFCQAASVRRGSPLLAPPPSPAVSLISALPAFPVAACHYLFSLVTARLSAVGGQEPSICPALSSAPAQGEVRKGVPPEGRAHAKSQSWEAIPSQNFGLFRMVLPSAGDLSFISYWLDFIL